MDAVASIISIVELTVSVSSACIAYARDVSHAADEAVALHEELGSLLKVLSRLQYPSISSNLRMELSLDLNICRDDLLLLQAKLKPTEPLAKIRQSLLWPFKRRGEFDRMLTLIQRHFSIFEKAVAISTLDVTVDIKAQLNDLRDLRVSDREFVAGRFDAIGEDVSRIKQNAKDEQRKDLFKWLNVVDYKSNYRDGVALATPSTGSWFFKDNGYFAKWLGCEDSPRNILVQGEAGAGKTVLMSSAVQTAFARWYPPSPHVCVAYYYFDFRTKLKTQINSMLCSFLHQAVKNTSTLIEALEKLQSEYPTHNMVPISELAEILQHQCSTFEKTFLFIDALDECEKVDELVHILSDISQNEGSLADIRFMCFSRDEAAIKRVLESSDFVTHALERSTIGKDIETYVRETLMGYASSSFRVFHDSSERLREHVINTLVRESGGMFRWVQCQVDEISRCRTSREIEDVLNDLPSTLVETYERMFKKMSKSDLHKAKRILSWLIGTDGAMSSNMLVEALTIDHNKLQLDKEDRLRNGDEISDICRSLVRESNHQSNYLWPDCKIISLAHLSVSQYLLSPQAREFGLDLRTIHLELARACLAYSTSSIWEYLVQSISNDDDFIPESTGELVKFLDYTCQEIFTHLQYDDVEHELVQDIISLLQDDQMLKNLERNCSIIRIWQEDLSHSFEMGLSINFRQGQCRNAITDLLGGPLRIDHTSSFLSKAVVAGLHKIPISLIEHTADFDHPDLNHQTPLAFVMTTGRLEMVQRFIIRHKEQHRIAASQHLPGAESISLSILRNTVNALFIAIVTKWSAATHMLFREAIECLDLFNDRSYTNSVYQMIIRLCAILSVANGASDVLALLQSHASASERMDVGALMQLREELLYVSVSESRAEYVQELLNAGVSPMARVDLPTNLGLLSGAYDNEINLESINNCWAFFLEPEVLLYELDDRDSYQRFSETEPKIIIAAGLHNPILSRLLLEKNSDTVFDNKVIFTKCVKAWLCAPDPEEETKDLEVIRHLLYSYLQRPENESKLNMALVICAGTSRGSHAVTRLLEIGADANCSLLDEDYRNTSTPLVAACQCVSISNVEALLNAGAYPNLEAQSGRIPCVAAFAARWGLNKQLVEQQRIFKLLKSHDPGLSTACTKALTKPAPVFHKYGFESRPGSVLCALIIRRLGNPNEEIPMEFLESNELLNHLDEHLIGDDYGTPLIAASVTNQVDFVDFLLEHGATVQANGHPGTEWSHPVLATIFADRWDLASRFLEKWDAFSTELCGEQRAWSMALMVVLGGAQEYHVCEPNIALKLIEGGVNIDFAMDEGISASILSRPKDSDDLDDTDQFQCLFDIGTPLYAACFGGNLTLIKKLQDLNASEMAAPAASSGNCLTAASASRNVEAVKIFMERKDDVNKCCPGRERWCPLVSAAQEGYETEETVMLLLENGARADISFPFKNPPAERCSLEVLALRLGKSLHFSLFWKRMWDDCTVTGPSILQAKPFFGTPFIAAAFGHSVDIMTLFAKQEGVDVNQEVSCGIYPTAMMATLDMKKMYRVAGPLRELGATEITISQMLNFSHPFRALRSDMVKKNVRTAVPGSFWGNMITLCVNVETAIPYLLEQGADPDESVPGSFYGSAFIAASALLRAQTIFHFLEHGCDVNAVVPDSPFGTPLIAACAGPAHYPFQWSFFEEYDLRDPQNWSRVQYDVLCMLLDKGADPNVTHNEFSPLIAFALCDCDEEYKINGLKLLLDYKADRDVRLPQWGYNKTTAGKQWSALSISEARGEKKIMEVLEQYKIAAAPCVEGVHVAESQ